MPPRQDSSRHIADLLAGTPLFAGLAAELLDELAAAGALLKLPSRSPLFASGEPIRDVHVLITGSIKRSALLADAFEKVLELAQPGQALALSEIFSAGAYASSAQTIKPCVVIAIPLASLGEIALRHPTLNQRLLETIARQHYATEFEVVSHHALPGTQRVLDYLLHLAGDRRGIAGETTVRLDASKKLIAARLDMTPETFSRTLRQLSSDGVIAVSGRIIHIQNATLAAASAGGKKRSAPLRYSRTERKERNRTSSAAALVNLCGRHRMLSQRMTTCWCIHARRLGSRPLRSALGKFSDQFERNLAQVTDLVTRLAPVLHGELETLRGLWTGYRDLLGSGQTPAPEAGTVFDHSERILAAADRLTASAARAAGTPEARCVNIAGRNRMLTARLAKLFLFADWGVRSARARQLIAASRQEFDANIAKLAAAGADSPEIAAQLAIDAEQWHALTSIIDATPHFPIEHGHAREVLAASDELLRHMDTTVKLFEHLADRKAVAGRRKGAAREAHSDLSQ